MKKLLEIKKITDLKYLNMYQAVYECDGGNKIYYNFASRRNLDELYLSKCNKVDAVRILPYIIENGKIFVVLIKEFRHPLNDYIYSTPAGLVERGEDTVEGAKRETEEEIGASVLKIEKVINNSFSSAGMTDESLECFEAEVVLDKSQHLDENEEITFVKVPFDELLNFVDSNKFCLPSALQIKMFYYKNRFLLNGNKQ